MTLLNLDWSFAYLLAQSSYSSVSDAEIILISILALAVYIFSSYCWHAILINLGEPNAWFAWVPILSSWAIYKAGNQSPWWIVGSLIPYDNFVAFVILIIAYGNIVKKLGKKPWLTLLMIIPLINCFALFHLAFGY